MDKNNWLKEILKLINLFIQIYLESTNTLNNIENYIKKSAKYLITLILISIPILLTIWGGLFLSLFFYITTKFELKNYTAGLIIALINLLIFIICICWLKYKFKHNKPEKNNLSILLIKLMHHLNPADRE